MEREIGEKFDFEGKELVVERANHWCNGCIFEYLDYKDCLMIHGSTGECRSKYRTDKTKVIFRYSETAKPKTGPTKAIKNDIIDNKVRMDLLPWEELEEVAKVYTAGAKKYGENKWQDLPNGYQRYKGAALRHLTELEKGNYVDEETGCLHAAQFVWNGIAMLHFIMKEMKEKK